MNQTKQNIPWGNNELRVLVVENVPQWRENHRAVLNLWGCKVVVAEHSAHMLLDDAVSKAKSERCHIAIVDMRLLDEDDVYDISGLELVRRLLPTASIIVSGIEDLQRAVESINEYGAFDFVGKEDRIEYLQQSITKVLIRLSIGAFGAKIIWTNGFSSADICNALLPDVKDVPPNEAYELIQCLFRRNKSVVMTPMSDSHISSHRTSSLRRRSRVFQAIVDEQVRQRVVKVAKTDKIQREIKNYRSFVDGWLKGGFHPRLESDAFLWDMGAIAYSYIGDLDFSPNGSTQTLTMAYRSAEHLDDILVPLHRFFDQIWNHWYTNHVSPLGDSLFASYDASWDGALSARLSAWQALEKLRTFAGVPASLPEPRRWLTVNHEECHLVRSARTAVTHGDLHGDNLFVDDRNAWPIDFERTGPGPILRDFVELIQDLLTRAARFSLADLPVFYELAVAICTPIRPDQRMQMTQAIKDHVEARKAFAVVQDLQLLAARRTQYTDRREYLWGLLLNSLFVVRLLDQEQDVTRQELTLLLAAVICDRLARWGNRNWRPKDSPPLNWIATRRKVITKPVRPRPDPATGETENLNADSSSTTPTGTDTSLQGGIIRGPVQIKLAPTLDSRAPVLHLELTLRPQGEHALAVWEAHVLGVRESTLTPPFGGQDLALVVRALDALQHPNYPAPMARNQYRIFTFSPEEQVRLAALGLWNTGATRLPADAHQRVGRRLYKALIADPIAATALRTVRDHATANGQRLALALRFPPEAVELAALPWELLWDEEPAPLMFSRGVRSDCTRHLDLAQALPPARPRQRPLRILAIAPLTGIDKDTRAGERDARQAAWQPLVAQGLVTVREVSPATRVAITNAIHQEQPDIIHYYGHGRYEAGTGALMLDETGGGKSWTDAPRLMTLFGGARLVALFACQGAMVGDDDSVGLLTGIAPALSAAGVPLVVGMQLTTRVSAATRASAVLYGALASGQSVQEAVARARQALYFEENDQASWYLPTLYVRSRETGPAFV